jgi:uncharacterized membrane protein YidH (DUF202 family)
MKPKTVILALIIMTMTIALAGCAKDDSSTDSIDRSDYLGSWNVQESWTKLSYDVTIIADSSTSNGVLIEGFAGTLETSPPAHAQVNGATITLDANQVIGVGLTINGSGVLSGGTINWDYTVFDGATLLQAKALYSRP